MSARKRGTIGHDRRGPFVMCSGTRYAVAKCERDGCSGPPGEGITFVADYSRKHPYATDIQPIDRRGRIRELRLDSNDTEALEFRDLDGERWEDMSRAEQELNR